MSEERTVRMVREVAVVVDADGAHCSEVCGCLAWRGGEWGKANSRWGCYLVNRTSFVSIEREHRRPYRPIRCKACVEGEVRP
jgi:hypothetical protein